MKKSIFTSFEEFEASQTAGDYERVTIINYNDRISADVMTEAKSIQMAVKKFFTAVKDIELFDGWKECALEMMEAGYFSSFEPGSYSFEVKEPEDNFFYITLTVWR